MSYDFQTDPLPIIAASPDDAAMHVCQFNVDWLQVLLGVVEDVLQNPESWDSEDDAVLEEMRAKVDTLLFQLSEEVLMSADYVGKIEMHGRADVPAGRLPCDGTTYNRVDYPELYDALDAAYKIDADTFKVPDFRNRSPMGSSQANPTGTRRGAETHTLTESEMPSHSHGTPNYSNLYGSVSYAGPLPVLEFAHKPTTPTPPTTPAGGSQPHNNVHPVEHVQFCIVATV